MKTSTFFSTASICILLGVPGLAQGPIVCGDCNSDGAIDILDTLAAAQHSAGLALLSPSAFVACNVQGQLGDPTSSDAIVDILDVLTVARIAAGLSIAFDCYSQPSCGITSPRPGATVTGDAVISFDVQDIDGDSQVATFEYSTNGGRTYSPMTVSPNGQIQSNPAIVMPGTGLSFAWSTNVDLPAVGGLKAYLPWAFTPPASAGQMSIVDIADGTTSSPSLLSTSGGAHGVCVSEQLGIVTMTGAESSVLWVLDLRTGATLGIVSLTLGGGMMSPRGVAIDPGGRRAFVGHTGGGLSEVDLVSMSETAYIPVPGSPQGVEYDPTSRQVYLSTYRDSILQVDAGGALALVGERSSGIGSLSNTLGTAIDPGKRLYVADFGKLCQLLVWDLSTAVPTFAGAYPVSLGGSEGYEVDLAKGGEFLYLTQEDDAIYRFDVSGIPTEVGHHDFPADRDIANVDVSADGRVFVIDGLWAPGPDQMTELSSDLASVLATYSTPNQVHDFFGDFLGTAPAYQVLVRITLDDGTSLTGCKLELQVN